MTKKQFVNSKGDTWEWDDNPTLEAFRERHDYSKLATPLKQKPQKKTKPQALRSAKARRKALLRKLKSASFFNILRRIRQNYR